MRRNQYRKAMVSFLVFIMLFNMTVFATTNSSYEVSGTSDISGTVSKDDVFIYNLSVKNVSGAQRTGVDITISGGFTPVSTDNLTNITFDNGDTISRAIPLKFNGADQKLTITIVDSTNSHSIVHTETITKAQVESSSPSTPVDTSKFIPQFLLSFGEKTPVFYAGKKQEFKFTIKNITNYQATEVYAQINPDANSPFNGATNAMVTTKHSLSGDNSVDLSVFIETKANAKSGFYTIPLQVISKNTYGKSTTEVKNVQVEVVNNEVLPSVIITGKQFKEPVLTPGKANVIKIDLKNLGSLDIRNLTAKLTGLKMDGIKLDADAAEKKIKSINAKGDDFVTYNILISDKLKDDQVELTLELSYHDENGSSYAEKLPVYLEVEQSGSDLYAYGIDITSLPSKVVPDQEFKVKYNFTNNSKITQKDLKLTLSSDGAFIFKSQPIVVIREIAPGQTKTIEHTMIAPKNMASNNYATYITLESLKDSSASRKEYLGIFVDGDSSLNSKPKIIIKEYNFGKDTILAGETFDLEITFFNTSNTMGIQNAKVAVSSDEGAFVPVNTASSFYIEKIGVKEEVTHKMTFKAKSDLNVKTYNVTADIEYEDSNGNSYDKKNNPYKATEKMGIPVVQELRLEIQDPAVPEVAYLYQPFEVNVEFFNMGKSPLQNTMVTTEGEFEVQDGRYFAGTFNSGANDYYTAMIIPTAEGEQTGKIVFEFEDTVGEKHVVEKEFKFMAMQMPEPPAGENGDMGGNFEGGGEFPMPEEKSFPWVYVIIGLVLVGVIATVVVKKRIQKKKEMALDD